MAVTELSGYNEFGLLIGDARGDDWAMWRGVEDSRFVFVPYDLDTMFENRTGSIYSAEGVPALTRLIDCEDIEIQNGVRAMLSQRLEAAEVDAHDRSTRGWTAFQAAESTLFP